jgi:hypothetical protein
VLGIGDTYGNVGIVHVGVCALADGNSSATEVIDSTKSITIEIAIILFLKVFIFFLFLSFLIEQQELA